MRPAAFDALAPLLIRRSSSAFARSPAASVSAFLHSIMPSPVRWRRSITMLAAISAMSSLQLRCWSYAPESSDLRRIGSAAASADPP